jgi:hypothetical protein
MLEIYIPIITAQLTDPFRIGLIAALIYTTIRTAAVTGWFVPLAAGIVFVAFIIAMTMPVGEQSQAVVISAGVVSNAIIAGLMFGALLIWRKFSK